MNDKLKKYPKTKYFSVKDTIGVPHPYCITPKHLTGEHIYLGEKEIIEAEEKHGAVCDTCKKINREKGTKILSYKEHGTALVINCKKKDDEALRKYLLSIKDMAEKDSFVGFLFVKDW